MIKDRSPDERSMSSCPRELEPGVYLSMAHGVAYLKGHVPSYERKKSLSAIVVATLPSVDRVVNLLRVVPGSLRADEKILEDVMKALTATHGPENGDIMARVTNGVVELEGSVPDLSGRVAAEAGAWSVCGVQHVDNRLQIRPLVRSGVPDMAAELRECLESSLGARSAWVELEFAQGDVVLKGQVLSPDDKLAVEDCLRWHPSVQRIANELLVAAEDRLSSLGQTA